MDRNEHKRALRFFRKQAPWVLGVALRCQLPAGLLACKFRTGAGFPVCSCHLRRPAVGQVPLLGHLTGRRCFASGGAGTEAGCEYIAAVGRVGWALHNHLASPTTPAACSRLV